MKARYRPIAASIALTLAVLGALTLVASSQEKSVRPGINQPFESPDVKKFIGVFEAESREIYAKRRDIVAACQLKPGMAVADIGAGTGFFTGLFSKEVGPTGQVYAVDIAPKFIEHIDKTCKEQGLKNVAGVVCTATSVELPPRSVDLAFICDTYHHFEFPLKTMRSIHDALRPGGRVVLIDFHRIEGKSSDWVMGHVRAGQDTFTKEILSCGFQLVDEPKLLKENYCLVFEKMDAAARRPNVIVVLTDDVGYGDFSCHGNPVLKTPHIDKLHRESIRLTDFHVCPMCTPTRGQLLTGRDALANGAMNVSSGRTPLRRGIPTMADIFAASGYRTGHFGKWHLGDSYPYRPQDRGFQETIYCKSWGISSAPDYWNNDCFDDSYWHNGTRKQFPGYNTDVFFGEAMKWMKERRRQREPFFAYLALTAAHGPHFVPDKYREPYRNQKPQVASFFGMIANIDENMGKLDAFLDTEGLRDDTVLIFMTDNGGTAGVQVYNAGMRGRKMELYEGGHRVPCFIRWPGGRLSVPGDVAELTQCQDLLPTCIELCGLKKPERADFDGTSLAARLRGKRERLPDRVLVVQYSRIQSPRPRACYALLNATLASRRATKASQ